MRRHPTLLDGRVIPFLIWESPKFHIRYCIGGRKWFRKWLNLGNGAFLKRLSQNNKRNKKQETRTRMKTRTRTTMDLPTHSDSSSNYLFQNLLFSLEIIICFYYGPSSRY